MLESKPYMYPVKIPEMHVDQNLDFLLLEPPPRYLPLMPNGLAYVDDCLRRHGHKVQVLDINIILYHRFHSARLMVGDEHKPLPSGRMMVEDPWTPTGVSEFEESEVIDHFWPHFEELLSKIEKAPPKVVGISVSSNSLGISLRFVQALRKRLPGVCVLIGGYICTYGAAGPERFKDFDYMVIGEAEVSLPPLAQALKRGERPKDLPGIVSRYDTPGRGVIDPVTPADITDLGFPSYHWIDLQSYSTFNGNHLVPISSSRGCAWGRCRFCSETFLYRKRSPQSVADEVAYLIGKGAKKFHFNESILGGDPDNLFNICTEFINRGFDANFTGQIHVNKKQSVEYLKHMKKAGFRHLRLGIDGWSENVLRNQRKGYNMKLVKQCHENCREAGISIDVNILIGVPGETEEDINETIENLRSIRHCVRAIGSYNTLNLTQGSEYFNYPEDYGIVFHGDKQEIYNKHKYVIPPELWYSVNPYIDYDVRIKRAEKVANALKEMGFNLSTYSKAIIETKRHDVSGSRPMPGRGLREQ